MQRVEPFDKDKWRSCCGFPSMEKGRYKRFDWLIDPNINFCLGVRIFQNNISRFQLPNPQLLYRLRSLVQFTHHRLILRPNSSGTTILFVIQWTLRWEFLIILKETYLTVFNYCVIPMFSNRLVDEWKILYLIIISLMHLWKSWDPAINGGRVLI